MNNNKKRKAEETVRRHLTLSNRHVRILARKYRAMLHSHMDDGSILSDVGECMLAFIDATVKRTRNHDNLEDWEQVRKYVEEESAHQAKQTKLDADCEAEEALRQVHREDECRRSEIEQAKREAYAEADALLEWSTSSEDE